MRLKFIGKDGSMGLKHGNVYPVGVRSAPDDPYIVVAWPDESGSTNVCPYSSPAAFAANWSEVGMENEKRPRGLSDSVLGRMQKADLIAYIRVLERRSNKYEALIKSFGAKLKERCDKCLIKNG